MGYCNSVDSRYWIFCADFFDIVSIINARCRCCGPNDSTFSIQIRIQNPREKNVSGIYVFNLNIDIIDQHRILDIGHSSKGLSWASRITPYCRHRKWASCRN